MKTVKFDIILNMEGVHTFKLGLNEFSDLSSHEFSMMNGYRPSSEEKVGQSHCDPWNNPQVFTEE